MYFLHFVRMNFCTKRIKANKANGRRTTVKSVISTETYNKQWFDVLLLERIELGLQIKVKISC